MAKKPIRTKKPSTDPRQVIKDLLDAGLEQGYWSQTQNSIKWFRTNVNKMTRGIKPRAFVDADSDRQTNRLRVGSMYMAFYDPKWKKELPYYDRFPLFIPIDISGKYVLGINLHYISPKYRAILLGKLLALASDKNYDDKTRLKITYGILKSSTRYKEYRPCIKKYLRSHFASRFYHVRQREWQVAIFLPYERFEKAT